jgi:hypothetical protein
LASQAFSQDEVAKHIEKFGTPPPYHQGDESITQITTNIFTELKIDMNKLGDLEDETRALLMTRIKKAYESPPYSDLNAWPLIRDWLKQNVNDPSYRDSIPN